MTIQRILLPAALLLAACGGSETMQAPAQPEPAMQESTFPTEPPAPLAIEDVDFPEYSERTLSNGARLLVVRNPEQPVVNIQLLMQGGSAADPAELAGLASVTASQIDKGTEAMTAREIAEAVDFIGARLGAGASSEWTSVSLTTITDFLDHGLDLMADVVLNPTFPAEELETEKRRRISSLRLQKSQPGSLAAEAFMEGVYGSHPYGRTETVESIEALDPADLESYHGRHFRPEGALFVVAGDVDADAIADRLEGAFSGWTGAPGTAMDRPAPPTRSDRAMVFVHKPGSVQAVIRVGHLMPSATEADWVTLDVANQVLGSGSAQFNAWMMEILREERGYTYGAYSGMSERQGPGYFMMNGEFRNEVADSSLMIMLDLAERLRAGDIPADDLEDAKLYLTGSFPLSIETPQQVAGQVASNRLLGRDHAYLEEYRSRVDQVTADDIARVTGELIRPDRALIVVVGDATEVLEKVRPFADRVDVVDPEGEPVDVTSLMAAAEAAAGMTYDASELRPRELQYGIMFQGNEVGTVVTRWTREGDAFAVVSEQQLPGMAVTQTTEFDALTFAPIRMSTDAGGMGTFALEVEDGRVTGQGFNPQQGPQDVDVALPEGTALEGQLDVALAVTDYQDVGELTLRILTSAGTVQVVSATVAGEETVQVPAGEFETYRLELQGQQTMTVWVTKAEPHIVVKRELAAQPVQIVLKSM
ncbi:MAG: insulinase family protein [Longimicrobiales bacterium]|nr:insulinase family protein [Longimicrobiales bacterium]